MNPDINAVIQHLIAELSTANQRLAMAAGVHAAMAADLQKAKEQIAKLTAPKPAPDAAE